MSSQINNTAGATGFTAQGSTEALSRIQGIIRVTELDIASIEEMLSHSRFTDEEQQSLRQCSRDCSGLIDRISPFVTRGQAPTSQDYPFNSFAAIQMARNALTKQLVSFFSGLHPRTDPMPLPNE
jgi:hypothetical protein